MRLEALYECKYAFAILYSYDVLMRMQTASGWVRSVAASSWRCRRFWTTRWTTCSSASYASRDTIDRRPSPPPALDELTTTTMTTPTANRAAFSAPPPSPSAENYSNSALPSLVSSLHKKLKSVSEPIWRMKITSDSMRYGNNDELSA